MIESLLRTPYQKFLVNPVASRIQPFISAVQITLLAGLFGLLIIPALLTNHVWLAISCLIISGYCDTLDGTLARLTKTTSQWGGALDIFTDRVVECSVILGLWTIAPQSRSLLCIVMLMSTLLCITSFLVVGILSVNQSEKSFHYSAGLMERAEAFLFFFAMLLLPNAFAWLATLYSVLTIFTALQRMKEFYQTT